MKRILLVCAIWLCYKNAFAACSLQAANAKLKHDVTMQESRKKVIPQKAKCNRDAESGIGFIVPLVEVDFTLPSGLRWKTRGRDEFHTKQNYSTFCKKRAGKMAGSIITDQHGYRKWSINAYGKTAICSRVIWTILHGSIPSGMVVEHKNGDPTCNKVDNLRLAQISQNKFNQKVRRDNKSGLKGVSQAGAKWKAVIFCPTSKKNKSLGRFNTPEEAHAAYVKAAIQRDPEFNRAV